MDAHLQVDLREREREPSHPDGEETILYSVMNRIHLAAQARHLSRGLGAESAESNTPVRPASIQSTLGPGLAREWEPRSSLHSSHTYLTKGLLSVK